MSNPDRKNRRRLTGLVLGLSLVAVASLVWIIVRSHQREAALDQLEGIGASIVLSYEGTEYEPPGLQGELVFSDLSLMIGGGQRIHGVTTQGTPGQFEEFVEKCIGEGAFADVVDIHIESEEFGDEHIPLLLNFGSLRELSLAGTDVTDKGVSQLAALQHLVVLDLTGCRISDAALVDLEALPLRELDVTRTGISREGIQEFRASHPDCQIDLD